MFEVRTISIHRVQIFLVVALSVFCAFVWSAAYAQTPQGSGFLTVGVLDVGQGDAIYIESPVGVQVLIDGGPDSSALRELPKVMPALDHSLDAIVETHPDADHIGGFVDLLSRYDVGAFITPGIEKDTAIARALQKEVEEQNIPRVLARRGMTLDLGGGAQLYVLYPDRDVSNLSSGAANEGGVVLQLVYGETEMLLMADVSKSVELRLLQLDGGSLESDILKVGHHGSRFSSARQFVSMVSPELAVISVGNNSYGHPTEEVLTVLGAAGAQIMRTDEVGTLVLRSDGVRFTR